MKTNSAIFFGQSLAMIAAMLLGACAMGPRAPEVVGEAHQVPYKGNVIATYLGALKSDPNWFVVDVQGKIIYVYGAAVKPTVQSAYLLDNTVINPGEDVLDMGTGSGVQAIFATRNAHRVVAVDIGPDAIKSAQYNVKLHGLENKIDVRLSDLFGAVKDDEQFDVIINNIEYPEDDLNSPLWDVHRRFFAQAKKYLKASGRILYQSGSIKNIPLVNQMVRENGFEITDAHIRNLVVQEKDLVFYVIEVARH